MTSSMPESECLLMLIVCVYFLRVVAYTLQRPLQHDPMCRWLRNPLGIWWKATLTPQEARKLCILAGWERQFSTPSVHPMCLEHPVTVGSVYINTCTPVHRRPPSHLSVQILKTWLNDVEQAITPWNSRTQQGKNCEQAVWTYLD